jgi:hypothetical protein
MAAPAHTLSGSRFLRPKLSRFFNQVAQVRPRISRIVKGAGALLPPMPDIFSSMFYTKPRTPPAKDVTTPRTSGRSRFLPPKMLSRFFNKAAQAPPRTSGTVKGTAALMPPMPDFFSSIFFSKPPKPPRHLRPHWPPGKPRGPGR